jgi:hypothetical protein
MRTKGAVDSAIRLSAIVLTAHAVDRTNTATICLLHHLLLAACNKAANTNANLLFPSAFIFLDASYILFKATFLLFFFIP